MLKYNIFTADLLWLYSGIVKFFPFNRFCRLSASLTASEEATYSDSAVDNDTDFAFY
jgi:hypothetical protein